MPKFFYKAKQGPQRIVDGVIDADNLTSAIHKIVGLKLTPLDVGLEPFIESKEAKKSSPVMSRLSFRFGSRVSQADVVLFTRQMSDLVDASVPILRSLQIVSNQSQNLFFKDVAVKMAAAVKDGGSFSDALAQHPQAFSNIYVNMVRAGEVSGQLEVILLRLADYLEEDMETRNKIKSGLAYPSLILIVGFVTVFVLLTFVIPRLSTMFDDLNQSLPLPTIILVNLSGFLARYWWLIIGVIIFIVMSIQRNLKTERGRRRYDEMVLKVPLLGEYIKIIEVGRFARTLGTLLQSGVVITTALKSVYAVAENSVVRDVIKKIADDVANGASLANAMRQSGFFPEMAVNMVAVGEETGRLERGLHKIAHTFEQQSSRITKVMVELLGPLVLVGIVSIVGFVVVAMLLPIFKMNLIVQ